LLWGKAEFGGNALDERGSGRGGVSHGAAV
jgi:hypothetical protein